MLLTAHYTMAFPLLGFRVELEDGDILSSEQAHLQKETRKYKHELTIIAC